MPLTDIAVRNAKPSTKDMYFFDGGGLFLIVTPGGSKKWRLKYQWQKKTRMVSLGIYPDVSLKDARMKRDDARKLLASGIDPSEVRRKEKAKASGEDAFETVARAWIAKMATIWSAGHVSLITTRLERDVFPWIGKASVRAITASDVLAVLHRMEGRGVAVSARRVRQIIGQVFRYATASGLADGDPTSALKGAITPTRETHHATITDPTAIGGLLRAIDGYQGSIVTRCALQLAPLAFVRPGELRHAEWSEIDLDKTEWRIPGAKMKMREQHVVPLARQAVAILRELHLVTGTGRYLFPSIRTADRPMSENTVLAALRRLGYAAGEMTGHGFRSMASTILNEQGWNRDAIERQLAHGERDRVRAAYNYAEHLPERRKMMQAWADYLDQLAGKNVIQLRREG
ncbi:MAG: tyrosine-type recombinase/integrase [Magnetococcus sp. DMHC-1]